jgi:hypothetical protein
MYEETVDIIDRAVLRATLKIPLDDSEPGGMREHLKPVNLARGSPRLFWSLVRLFGQDVAGGLKQLFPEVTDWSWLTDRRRELSEKARMNQQQEREAAAEKAARKRERAGGKSATDGGDDDDDDDVVFVGGSQAEPSAAAAAAAAAPAIAVAPASPAGHDFSAMLAADLYMDVALEATLRATTMDGLVDANFLPALVAYFDGHNSALLLAALDFYEPRVVDAINAVVAATSSSSTSSSSSAPQLVSMDVLEMWVQTAQHQLMRSTMNVLCGGCRKLKAKLAKFDKIKYPGQLWAVKPEKLHKVLLQHDPSLSNVRLTRGDIVQPFSLGWVEWMVGTARGITYGRRTEDVVSWMKACRPDTDAARARKAAKDAAAAGSPDSDTLAAEADVAEAVDEGFDEYDPDDDDEEEEQEQDDDDDAFKKEGWLFGATDHPFIGHRVRVFVLSEEYWDEATVAAYLPPTDEEPMALWKVRLAIGEKKWAQDLEEHEVVEAMKRADDVTR